MNRGNIYITALVTTLLCVIIQARSSSGGMSGQQRSNHLSEVNYAYTYGDLNYEYDMDLQSQSEIEIPQDVEELSGGALRTKEPFLHHEVVDDIYNYDYTYGDPDVYYDYDGKPDSKDNGYENHTTVANDGGEGDDGKDDGGERDDGEDDDVEEGIVAPLVTVFMKWVLSNWREIKHAQKTYNETKEHVRESWGKIKKSLGRIRDALGEVLLKLGKEAEQGLKYCLVRFEDATNTIGEQGQEVIYKLEKLLTEGNETVASLFRLLGNKIGEFSQRYREQPLFTQDLKLSNYFTFVSEGDEGNRVPVPDLFEDPEVLTQLELLVNENILQKEEVEELLTAAAQQTQQAIGRKYPQKIILGETGERLQEGPNPL